MLSRSCDRDRNLGLCFYRRRQRIFVVISRDDHQVIRRPAEPGDVADLGDQHRAQYRPDPGQRLHGGEPGMLGQRCGSAVPPSSRSRQLAQVSRTAARSSGIPGPPVSAIAGQRIDFRMAACSTRSPQSEQRPRAVPAAAGAWAGPSRDPPSAAPCHPVVVRAGSSREGEPLRACAGRSSCRRA